MFIRRTQVGSNAAGKQHYTYRLVRSERIGGKVKQITLLNLGRYFPISSEFWPALCDRVDELLAGQASLLEPSLPKAAAMEAEHIAAQLLSRQALAGVDGHLFITVLAYQFVQLIRRRLKEHAIHEHWSILREILSVQRRVTASFRRADGGTLHARKATRPETELAAIYHALDLDPLPGGIQKTIMP